MVELKKKAEFSKIWNKCSKSELVFQFSSILTLNAKQKLSWTENTLN